MASNKEQCFREALRLWQEATGNDLKADFFQRWVKNADGTWSQSTRNVFADIMSWVKTKLFLAGVPDVEPGSVWGLRYPDITMPGPDGNTIIPELKFTNQAGKPDPWGDGQKEAYDEIMKQQNGPDSSHIVLDKNTCECPDDPTPEFVFDENAPAKVFTRDNPYGCDPFHSPQVPFLPGVPGRPGVPVEPVIPVEPILVVP